MALVDPGYYARRLQALVRYQADEVMLLGRLEWVTGHCPHDQTWRRSLEHEVAITRALIRDTQEYVRHNRPRTEEGPP